MAADNQLTGSGSPPPQYPIPPQFIQIATAVLGNLILLVVLDDAGDVWQYQHSLLSAAAFEPHNAWRRLGRGRIIPE